MIRNTRASGPDIDVFAQEPTLVDLAAIEGEWPLIAAELALVDAEIAAARAGAEMTELDRRRVRRSSSALTRTITDAVRRPDGFGDAA